jgi:hypothetical protein
MPAVYPLRTSVQRLWRLLRFGHFLKSVTYVLSTVIGVSNPSPSAIQSELHRRSGCAGISPTSRPQTAPEKQSRGTWFASSVPFSLDKCVSRNTFLLVMDNVVREYDGLIGMGSL